MHTHTHTHTHTHSNVQNILNEVLHDNALLNQGLSLSKIPSLHSYTLTLAHALSLTHTRKGQREREVQKRRLVCSKVKMHAGRASHTLSPTHYIALPNQVCRWVGLSRYTHSLSLLLSLVHTLILFHTHNNVLLNQGLSYCAALCLRVRVRA